MKYILIYFIISVISVATPLEEYVHDHLFFRQDATEDRLVVKSECLKLGHEFTYLEISIFAESGNVGFLPILDKDGVDVDSLSRLVFSCGLDKLSSDNILWIRTAPLYRTPTTIYSGVWIRFNTDVIEFMESEGKNGLVVVDSGVFESIGSPSVIVE